jgi:hypothetical protein
LPAFVEATGDGCAAGLGAGVAATLAIWKGIRFGGGFLIGAAVSYLSFWRWERVVESIGPDRPRRPQWWALALRLLLLIAAAYAIITLTGFNPAAAVIGLLLPAAAVTFEIIYELIHGN